MADFDIVLDDLRRLVEVESPSLDTDALHASAGAVAALMLERTGRAPTLIEGPAGPHVHWKGGGEPKVLILGHHDTVFPLGTLERRPFQLADGKVTGPAVFDMKFGVVQAIHAVAELEDASGVEMLFTADEEVGAITSRQLLEERAVACGNVLVLEASADGGAVKTARKGTGTFEVVINGRASHAGLEPEKGVNALIEASRQVLRISEFGDTTKGTTVTPTVAHAGTADNVVPAQARIAVDVRVTNAAEKQRIEAAFAALAPFDPEATIEITGSIGRPPMPESASASLFALVQQIDPTLRGVAVGGGSDGNFTAALGVATLDGLGAVGGGAHADHEFVLADTMVPRVELLRALIAAITASDFVATS